VKENIERLTRRRILAIIVLGMRVRMELGMCVTVRVGVGVNDTMGLGEVSIGVTVLGTQGCLSEPGAPGHEGRLCEDEMAEPQWEIHGRGDGAEC
jgi:hypothetical protein